MKKTCCLSRIVSFFILYSFANVFFLQAQSTQRVFIDGDISKWINYTFAKGKIPPFSFVYNGKTSSSFIKKWKYEIKKEESDDVNIIKYSASYLDPQTGLKVDCLVKGFKDFNAVEWVLNFTNTSDNNSPTIEQVKVVDFTFQSKSDGDFILHYAKGSNAHRLDFSHVSSTLGLKKAIKMHPTGGRSSDESGFPFFNIELSDHTGVVTAIGWTGNWYADVEKVDAKSVNLDAGMLNLKLFLNPKETIRTPGICMLFWQNEDRMAGHNQFRRFILAHHSRVIDGKFAEYPISGGFNWGDPYPCNEYSCMTEDYACALVNRYKQFGITPEVYWLDAGWYPGSGNWFENAGNWSPDLSRFPNTLKPISDATHKVGSKFMVWFEPERVFANTQFAKEHPGWMLKCSADGNNFLFDLTNREALEWFCKYFGDFIEANGIDYYRQDFNIRPEPYWTENDEPGRTGITEIRYIEGLYAYWDYLLHRFPNLLIDNCASGGRRLDLETVSRSAPLWRTDYQYGEVNGYQCHTYGLNFFIPLSGTGLYKTDSYSFRSALSAAVVLNWKITNADLSIPEMQKCVADFKALRPYYYEDFYPLTGVGDLSGDDVWLAYQMNKPSDNSGIVVAFRRKDNTSESIPVKLKGLNMDAVYSIYNDNDQSIMTKTGKELSKGIMLEIASAPGSLLLKYYVNP